MSEAGYLEDLKKKKLLGVSTTIDVDSDCGAVVEGFPEHTVFVKEADA